MIKKFEDFNNSIDIDSIIDSIPDSDVPSETNIIQEIGDKVIFMYKGKKLWEGDNKTILNSGVEELDNFVFANKLLRKLKSI